MSLVTSNDTDPAERARDAAADGSGKNFGIMWRVNGEAIWSKGARTWGPKHGGARRKLQKQNKN